ncbi:MAG: addiction module component CHP02574 family protein [Flavobacterium sp.]
MRPQIIQDQNGKTTGVFITIEDWENIKRKYPNIEKADEDLPQWQKEIIDARLLDLKNPQKLKPIEHLFDVLDEEI